MEYLALFGGAKLALEKMEKSANVPVVAECPNSLCTAFIVLFPEHVKRTDPIVSEYLHKFFDCILSNLETMLLEGLC
jgi:hypothetical protein